MLVRPSNGMQYFIIERGGQVYLIPQESTRPDPEGVVKGPIKDFDRAREVYERISKGETQ